MAIHTIPSEAELEIIESEPESEREAPQQLAPIAAQIPASMWNAVEGDILLYIQQELNAALSERGEFERKLARWKLVYDAPMPDGPKTFPFYGASNLTLPVVKESVNTLVAQLVQSTMTVRPYWVLRDLANEWEPFVDELEQFLDLAGDRDLKLDKTGIPWIIETAKMGTSIVEVGHDVQTRRMYQVSADGKRAFPKRLIKHDGPITYNMALEDFFIRFTEQDIQSAQWCAKRVRMNEVQLKEEERKGRFYGVDKILEQREGKEPPEPQQEQEESEKTKPTVGRPFEIYEIWMSFDVDQDEDGEFEEIVVYYSMEADCIVGRQFHPYHHGKRPFVALRYFPVENRFYGQGLCEMLEQIQEAVSTRYNQRSDNITVNSMKMFLKRKGVRGLQPGDPLYTGKIIEVMDVHSDIRELQMGEIYPSTVQEEMLLRQQAERLSGLNEAVMGAGSPVTRTTASAQLALIQEQAKRIDLTVRSIRSGFNEVGGLTLDLYFQFGVNGKGIAWMGERGRNVEAIFRLPKRIIELGLAIKTQVPTSLQNRQVKRENALAMFNLLNGLYEQMLPLVQHMAPEHLPNVVREMVRGGQKFLGDVLETFDVSDPEDALAGLAILERVLPAAEDMGGMDSFARRIESAQVLEKIDGLEDLLRQAESARNRDPGTPIARRESVRVPPPTRGAGELPEGLVFGGEPG